MRIAFVITGLSTGGAEMMLLKLIENLDRARISCTVISLTGAGDLTNRFLALGVPVIAIRFNRSDLGIRGFWNLHQHINRLKPDLVHTWMYHADLLGGLVARLASVRHIAWCIRNSDLDVQKTKRSTRLIVHLSARLSRWIPERIVSCSHSARQLHESLGYRADKMVVIPNGFDVQKFKPEPSFPQQLRHELGLNSDSLLVGMMGRFDPQKNHLGFLQSAARVYAQLPNTHFVLAGRDVDPGNATLTQSVANLGLTGHVHLLGLRQDMPLLMGGLDVLVSASAYGEAFPNVLGEAMACEVPCVTTDVGDSAYIVGDTGIVVEPHDAHALAQAIVSLISQPDSERKRLGVRARQRVLDYFEIGAVAERYANLYENLLR